MARKAMRAMSDALETACGWAILAVAAYLLLFVNITGGGALWDSVRGVLGDSGRAGIPDNAAVQMRVVPVRPVDQTVKTQDHMLMVPEAEERSFKVPVLA
ncbi:MAG: hypothetical protein ACHQ2Z_14430, partial [Elusimicrobiota bacterium]